jgi:hypothetical protein
MQYSQICGGGGVQLVDILPHIFCVIGLPL